MKYNEIIHVNEQFIPVMDLENEDESYWRLFIPNNDFKRALTSVIDSLDNPLKYNPVWLQGTYGTGKTHATSVIKHLLCDDEINFNLDDNQLTSKLEGFRNKNNVFPVILKGTSTISDSRRFNITIQTAVEKALNTNDMQISIESDFEKMIRIVRRIKLTEEEKKGTKIEFYDVEDIIQRLENRDTEILMELDDIILGLEISTFNNADITKWLIEVENELKRKYDIDYLMIFWDEFTGALTLPNFQQILLNIQNIAEAKNKGISLFIVSHRTRSNQQNINNDIIDKVMDRFKLINYSMNPVTTYELMEKSLKKENKWDGVKERFVWKINPIVNKIAINEESKTKQSLINLYPIHPYTSFLASFIAQEIGSTERSIFKFLHDDTEHGFKYFIDKYDVDERYFLTADYLWDFFYEDFKQSDDERIKNAIAKYDLTYGTLKEKRGEYSAVFKVILLLNILYKIAEVSDNSPIIPLRDNIIDVFSGSICEDKVETVLKFIDESGIINETPNHLFELTTNSLPADQIEREKEKLINALKIDKILTKRQKDEFKDYISKKLNRESTVALYDADMAKNKLMSELEKNKGKAGYLELIIFLCKSSNEFGEIKEKINSIPEKELLKNKIIIVPEVYFEDLNRYLDYEARSKVAEKHNYKEDANSNKRYADDCVNNWIRNIKTKYISYYLNNEESKLLFSEFPAKINTELSKEIFSKGLENIEALRKTKTLWTKVISKSQAEKYVTATSLEELHKSLSGQDIQSIGILKDNNGNYVVDGNLNLKTTTPDNHPLKLIQDFVDETFEEAQKKGTFNLGEELQPLSDVPYGLYPNKNNIAALSFALRKYIDKVYDFDGRPIDKTKMKDKISKLFEYWDTGKHARDLDIRFGSEYEKKLIELLNNVFSLELERNEQSIDNVRWKIRQWIKDKKTPLWIYKEYSENIDDGLKSAIDEISELLKPKDKNIPDKVIQECYESLEPVKLDFKEITKENTDALYESFITDFMKTFPLNDISEVRTDIEKRMPEEVYDWSKSDLQERIVKIKEEFDKKESEKKNPKKDGGHGTGGINKDGDTKTTKYEQDDYIKNKINKLNENKLKEIIIKAISEDERVKNIIEKYLED